MLRFGKAELGSGPVPKLASLAESVAMFWFWKPSEVMI
jgi:hypothetical protein